uniref:Cytochrome c oxidase subunit 6a, mitochondrial n=1 Tax=Aegilops tauschii subsp. strangulata TaxID=200361 RepID=A0A453LVW4_AEGTS
MASLAARSGLRSLAARARAPAPATGGRRMSSSAHDDAYETAKWEKITIMGAVTCTLLAAWNLSKGHPHFDEPPVRSRAYAVYFRASWRPWPESDLFLVLQAYPYLHIRNKEFPWGPNGLFEVKHDH